MARSRPDTSKASTRKRFHKEGRGLGHGASYKGYIGPRDTSSVGHSWRIPGWKVGGRIVSLLSNLERDYCYFLEYHPLVVEYKEQFPLPLERTKVIAQKLGVKHPAHPASKGDIVMTTDFVVSFKVDGKNVVVARAIKPSTKLDNKRVLEKLEIERQYWLDRGIDWAIRTEKDIDRTLAANVKAVHNFYHLDDYFVPGQCPSEARVDEIRSLLMQLMTAGACSLLSLAKTCDQKLGLPEDTSFTVAKHLICRHQLPVNFRKPFRTTECLQLLGKGETNGTERELALQVGDI